jgi:pimeloyl-ACP methyl ester carboxylesterase
MAPTSIEHLEIPIGDLTFTARAAGPADGRLVVLLHGFPETAQSWDRQLAALGDAGYRALAPDQRGYSRRARPEGTESYKMDHLVADVLGMVDWLGGHRFDLVGHDWGGAVAWRVGGRFPERLRTLTVLSTPHPAAFTTAIGEGDDQAARSSYMLFFRQEGSEDLMLADDATGLRNLFGASGLTATDPDAVERYVAWLSEPGALKAALNWYRAVDLGDVTSMGEITTPTMYVWSTDDAALGSRAAIATAEHVPGEYRFEVLDGVSHWIAEQAPDQLNALLLDWLSSHP